MGISVFQFPEWTDPLYRTYWNSTAPDGTRVEDPWSGPQLHDPAAEFKII